MSEQELADKRQAVSDKFDELAKQRESIDDELKRLQGEYRVLSSFIGVETTPGSDAQTIVVEEAEPING